MRHIAVVGSSSYIGRALVRDLLARGDCVHALSRSILDQTQFVDNGLEYRRQLFLYSGLELEDNSSIKSTYELIKKNSPYLNGVAILAGQVNPKPFTGTSIKDLYRALDSNLLGSLYFCQLAVRLLMKAQADCRSIVFTSSISARHGSAGRFSYSLSKSAVNGAVRALANELGPLLIRVNAVSPGLIDSPMLHENTQKEVVTDVVNRIPLKRLGTASDVASTVSFLLSQNSAYITGQVIDVDGGLV